MRPDKLAETWPCAGTEVNHAAQSAKSTKAYRMGQCLSIESPEDNWIWAGGRRVCAQPRSKSWDSGGLIDPSALSNLYISNHIVNKSAANQLNSSGSATWHRGFPVEAHYVSISVRNVA